MFTIKIGDQTKLNYAHCSQHSFSQRQKFFVLYKQCRLVLLAAIRCVFSLSTSPDQNRVKLLNALLLLKSHHFFPLLLFFFSQNQGNFRIYQVEKSRPFLRNSWVTGPKAYYGQFPNVSLCSILKRGLADILTVYRITENCIQHQEGLIF